MVRWISSSSVIDLLAVDGLDAGRRFTVDSQEVAISRGWGNESGVIHLHDPTVSRHQALIRSGSEGLVLEHRAGATNETRVNGEPISIRSLAPGDSIQVGRVVLEVRAHRGLALSGLLRPRGQKEESIREDDSGSSTEALDSDPDVADDTTEAHAVAERSPLTLVAHLGGRERRYPLRAGVNKVGRHASCDIRIPSNQTSVSRHQLDLVVADLEVTLVHRSAKSTTVLNGKHVADEARVSPGDQLEIGDVLLELACDAMDEETTVGISRRRRQRHSLRNGMEELREREERIEREYSVVGSFLDVDVVGALDMKRAGTKPSQIVLSFERWRDWVTSIVEEFKGHALNSNGDELMCFFEAESHARRAVYAGGAMLSRLDHFNDEENLLPMPFRLRLGIHTGESLVDRKHGYAYSAVLDTAGHLQKQAETNGLLASKHTYEALGEPDLMERAGALERDGVNVYRLRADRLSG